MSDATATPTTPAAITVASQALSPGETTSEHAAMTSATLWAKIMQFSGVIIAIIPQIGGIFQTAGLDQTNWGKQTLSIFGAILAVAGVISHSNATVAYVNGRSFIKASAVKDVPPETPLNLPPA